MPMHLDAQSACSPPCMPACVLKECCLSRPASSASMGVNIDNDGKQPVFVSAVFVCSTRHPRDHELPSWKGSVLFVWTSAHAVPTTVLAPMMRLPGETRPLQRQLNVHQSIWTSRRSPFSLVRNIPTRVHWRLES